MPVNPLIIATWKFGMEACAAGWAVLKQGGVALDAVEAASRVTESNPAVTSVGKGGLPNAEGVVELDAAIMDGRNHRAGAVAGLMGIDHPISVARRILERNSPVFLVGENAFRFAIQEGFEKSDLLTEHSSKRWEEWKTTRQESEVAHFDSAPLSTQSRELEDHDTIGICAMDQRGDLAVACTTSGMAWKMPGRVGDSPIIGAGLYVDNEIGCAAATGYGDEMMKTCLSYRVVLNMERGFPPKEACIEALRYLLKKRPPQEYNLYGAALIALRKDGQYGATATASDFPDRLWNWAVSTSDHPVLQEGPYVTLTDVYTHLPAANHL